LLQVDFGHAFDVSMPAVFLVRESGKKEQRLWGGRELRSRSGFLRFAARKVREQLRSK